MMSRFEFVLFVEYGLFGESGVVFVKVGLFGFKFLYILLVEIWISLLVFFCNIVLVSWYVFIIFVVINGFVWFMFLFIWDLVVKWMMVLYIWEKVLLMFFFLEMLFFIKWKWLFFFKVFILSGLFVYVRLFRMVICVFVFFSIMFVKVRLINLVLFVIKYDFGMINVFVFFVLFVVLGFWWGRVIYVCLYLFISFLIYYMLVYCV